MPYSNTFPRGDIGIFLTLHRMILEHHIDTAITYNSFILCFETSNIQKNNIPYCN